MPNNTNGQPPAFTLNPTPQVEGATGNLPATASVTPSASATPMATPTTTSSSLPTYLDPNTAPYSPSSSSPEHVLWDNGDQNVTGLARAYREKMLAAELTYTREWRDTPLRVQEGQFKSWEEADGTYFVEPGQVAKDLQRIPEVDAKKSLIVVQTPSASVYFRKKYFRLLVSSAAWSPAFQSAITDLMIQKTIDIATVEALTKYRNMYGVSDTDAEGTLTKIAQERNTAPQSREYNHYRAYWYGKQVTGIDVGGVLEVTNFTSLSTSLSVETGDSGSCTINLEDPYNLLYVSKKDIDNLFEYMEDLKYDDSSVAQTQAALEKKLADAQQALAEADAARKKANEKMESENDKTNESGGLDLTPYINQLAAEIKAHRGQDNVVDVTSSARAIVNDQKISKSILQYFAQKNNDQTKSNTTQALSEWWKSQRDTITSNISINSDWFTDIETARYSYGVPELVSNEIFIESIPGAQELISYYKKMQGEFVAFPDDAQKISDLSSFNTMANQAKSMLEKVSGGQHVYFKSDSLLMKESDLETIDNFMSTVAAAYAIYEAIQLLLNTMARQAITAEGEASTSGENTVEADDAYKKAQDAVAQATKDLDDFNRQHMGQRPVAKLKSGATFTRKAEVDNLYRFLAGRSIFTVMDEIYVWMSSAKEQLMDFNLMSQLLQRYNELKAKLQPTDKLKAQLEQAIKDSAALMAKAKGSEGSSGPAEEPQATTCDALIRQMTDAMVKYIQGLRPQSVEGGSLSDTTPLDPAVTNDFFVSFKPQLAKLCTSAVAKSCLEKLWGNYNIENVNYGPQLILGAHSGENVSLAFSVTWSMQSLFEGEVKYDGILLYDLSQPADQQSWTIHSTNGGVFVTIDSDPAIKNMSTSDKDSLQNLCTQYHFWLSAIGQARNQQATNIHLIPNIETIIGEATDILLYHILSHVHTGTQALFTSITNLDQWNYTFPCWAPPYTGVAKTIDYKTNCSKDIVDKVDESAVIETAIVYLRSFLNTLNDSDFQPAGTEGTSTTSGSSGSSGSGSESTSNPPGNSGSSGPSTQEPGSYDQSAFDDAAAASSDQQISDQAKYYRQKKEKDKEIEQLTETINQQNAYLAEMKDIKMRFSGFGLDPDSNPDVKDLLVFALEGGIQVFSGVVTRVSEAYNDGVHTVSISASSVMRFLEMTRFINTPSVTNFGGLLYDPIDVKVEGDGTISAKGATFSWRHGQYFAAGNVDLISIFTGANDKASALESKTYDYARRVGFTFEKFPLEQLDSANIISVITTGLAFNPSLALKLSVPDSDHSFRRYSDPTVARSPIPDNWINLLQISNSAQNKVFGNFVPFGWIPADITIYNPKIFTDEAYLHSLQFFDKTQATTPLHDSSNLPTTLKVPIKITNKDLKAALLKFLLNSPAFQGQPQQDSMLVLSTYGQASAYIDALSLNKRSSPGWPAGLTDDMVNAEIDAVLNQIGEYSDVLKNFVVHDVIEGYPSKADPQRSDLVKCIDYRDAQNSILQNSRADVVMNIDQNFLVIDMTYTASIAVRAFNFQLNTNTDFWNTDRLSPKQLCEQVAEQLDWEFFPDSQGNIWYRKPQYNRVPLSVYKEKILPYVLSFLKNSYDDFVNAASGNWATWERSIGYDASHQKLLKYLPGIDKTWVQVYRHPYLLAQLLEVDYPIEESSFAEELFGDSTVVSSVDRSHYYIKDKDILSWSFEESEPKFCRLDVAGAMEGVDGVPEMPKYLYACGVDFDLWAHYGFREEKVQKNFMRNALEQGLPYVAAYLTQQYSALRRGSIQVVGNPFYQAGEVVYIESRNMLFYVIKVAHNFSYGGQFTTTLTLGYGHCPGEWVSNPYDATPALLSHDTRFLTDYDVESFVKLVEYQQQMVDNAGHASTSGSANVSSKLPPPYLDPDTASYNPSSHYASWWTPAAAEGGTQTPSPTQTPSSTSTGECVPYDPVTGLAGTTPPHTTWDPSIVDRLTASLYYNRTTHKLDLVQDLRKASQNPGLTKG
jgi:hypothetical protein